MTEALHKMTNLTTERDLLSFTLETALRLAGSSRGWISRFQLDKGLLKMEVAAGEPAERMPLKIGEEPRWPQQPRRARPNESQLLGAILVTLEREVAMCGR